eukprot:CAMPEP_0179435312 /NCGR_PEP_ID=MMETSP0799-20121207/19458_1 /TAXON_ID=46947 /ORGANISM="Geminigera cryophila, Strain CCMP2564" /LENGTH=101 /DNA_ID=CAMNT_0021214629 /DNA_START=87 /DNA_END=389 /DNA_ORIENTATION=+
MTADQVYARQYPAVERAQAESARLQVLQREQRQVDAQQGEAMDAGRLACSHATRLGATAQQMEVAREGAVAGVMRGVPMVPAVEGALRVAFGAAGDGGRDG